MSLFYREILFVLILVLMDNVNTDLTMPEATASLGLNPCFNG